MLHGVSGAGHRDEQDRHVILPAGGDSLRHEPVTGLSGSRFCLEDANDLIVSQNLCEAVATQEDTVAGFDVEATSLRERLLRHPSVASQPSTRMTSPCRVARDIAAFG